MGELGQVDLFKYSDPRKYLSDVSAPDVIKLGSNQTFKLWSKRLEYSSHRSLGMVLRGKRLPSKQMLRRLSDALNHSVEERHYLDLLVERTRLARRGQSVDTLENYLRRMRQHSLSRKEVSPEEWHHLFQWYVFVLRQLIGCPSFNPDPAKISRSLKRKVSADQIRHALETLVALGLIKQETPSKKYKLLVSDLMSRPDVPSAEGRSHLRQMLMRATEALEEWAPEEREFTSLTFRFNPSDIPKIKKRIRDFRDELDRTFTSEKADAVYQYNVQFFPHAILPKSKRGKR